MIIQRIEIKNFRSYYGENCFEFKNGLTLIIGDNGDGKTTFFEALQWLFNTTIDTPSIENFSEMRKSELEVGETDTISVSMTFEHDGVKRIEKRFSIARTSNDRFSVDRIQFTGYEDRDSGRVQVDGKILVQRCFDAFIQKFSMFKGESDLNVFNDATALQQLVAKYSDLKTFDKYVEYATEFERKSNSAYIKESKSDEKISREAERLDYQLTQVRGDIRVKSKDINDLQTAASFFSGKIDDLEKTKETSEKYREVKERLDAKNQEAARIKGQIAAQNFNVNLLDRMWVLCAFPAVLKEFQDKSSSFSKLKRSQNDQFIKEQGKKEGKAEIIQEFTELVNGSSRLPWYLPNQETMEEMIHDHICKVCGREAPEGSDAYRFMVEKLNEYKQHALAEAETQKAKDEEPEQLFKNTYTEEIHSISLNLGGFNESVVTGKANDIKEKVDLVNFLKGKLEKVEESIADMKDEKARILIQADGVSEDMLTKSFSDLKGYFEQKSNAERKINDLERELKDLKDKEKYIKDQLDDLNPCKGQVKVYKRVHDAFDRILSAFINAKEKNLTLFLQSLEERANNYLAKLNANDFHGIVKLVRTVNNDSAVIKLYSSNGVEITKPSGSQKTTMYMSVLFAISDLTTLKREEDYPLIFDAATSSFGDTKEDDFYNIIDNLEKQCIIVTKDFLNKSALKMDEINKLTCSVYRIKKAEGYNDEDLSTIRTTVEKVK